MAEPGFRSGGLRAGLPASPQRPPESETLPPQAPDPTQLGKGAPGAAVGDPGLMPNTPTPSNPGGGGLGLLGFRVWLPTLDRNQWRGMKWYLTGYKLGLNLTLARAAGLAYDQKHMEIETSVPKSGPRRLNLPQQVCVGDSQTGML